MWVFVLGTPLLVGWIAGPVLTNSRAAAALAEGGRLTTARVIRATEVPASLEFEYPYDGKTRRRTLEVADDVAQRWGPALEAAVRRRADAPPGFRTDFFHPLPPVDVRVPADAPDQGVPDLSASPPERPAAADRPGIVRGTVTEVRPRRRDVTVEVAGTPPVTLVRSLLPDQDPRVGETSDIVFLESTPQWSVEGPPGSLFPTRLQRFGIPGAAFALLFLGVGLRHERKRMRRRRLLETGIERPALLLTKDVAPAHAVLHGLLELGLLAVHVFGSSRTTTDSDDPPLRRCVLLRVDGEERQVTRVVAARIAIPGEAGDPVSVVSSPRDPFRFEFPEELLASLKLEDPTPDVDASPATS